LTAGGRRFFFRTGFHNPNFPVPALKAFKPYSLIFAFATTAAPHKALTVHIHPSPAFDKNPSPFTHEKPAGKGLLRLYRSPGRNRRPYR
jgi:hypothetical protein